MHDGLLLLLSVIAALALDRLLGEPRRYHPLVGFGYLAAGLERRLNTALSANRHSSRALRMRGGLAWALLVLPLPLLLVLAEAAAGDVGSSWWQQCLYWLLAIVALYLSVGWQSLREHGQAVAAAFTTDGIASARQQVARIVSRDTDTLDEAAVSRATIESMLENGSDAVFAPLFWFVLLGPAGAVLYRLANTLDAMWGYRTPRLQAFGFCSAKLDDVFNYIPARLTALSYALLGQTRTAWRCWRQQARHCASPNGGPVMCSGAGSLGIELGGGAHYHGQWQTRARMGCGRAATINDITRSIQLVDRTVWLWLGLGLAAGLGGWIIGMAVRS